MSDSADKANPIVPGEARQAHDHDDHLEDEEKIMAGRHDVNYPALLTRDVPGG